jgi:hypothetical protein
VASPFQAFFPLAFVSYAALAIVRPLRGLRWVNSDNWDHAQGWKKAKLNSHSIRPN